jgi:hypothetical protein
MLPNFVFPETEVRKDGEGPAVPVEDAAGKTLQLTLGITEVVEQESLEVAVHGSADASAWTAKPLASFPPKFYTGVHTVLLDLSATPDIQFLQVKYKASRWGHWTTGPVFRFYVFAEPVAP